MRLTRGRASWGTWGNGPARGRTASDDEVKLLSTSAHCELAASIQFALRRSLAGAVWIRWRGVGKFSSSGWKCANSHSGSVMKMCKLAARVRTSGETFVPARNVSPREKARDHPRGFLLGRAASRHCVARETHDARSFREARTPDARARADSRSETLTTRFGVGSESVTGQGKSGRRRRTLFVSRPRPRASPAPPGVPSRSRADPFAPRRSPRASRRG